MTIVHEPPLARALYRDVDLGQQIPEELFGRKLMTRGLPAFVRFRGICKWDERVPHQFVATFRYACQPFTLETNTGSF